MAGSVERPREAEAAALPGVGRCRRGNGEIDERHSAEFAVDLAGRLDVVGDGEIGTMRAAISLGASMKRSLPLPGR